MVLYLVCRFKVTVRVMGNNDGTLVLRVGLARRTRAELTLQGPASGGMAEVGKFRAQR
jgi:hypothetical protein